VRLLRLELLALSAVNCESGRHWCSYLNRNLLLYNRLLWWGLKRLKCSLALLKWLNILALLERILFWRKTIRLKVKRGRIKLLGLLGKIVLWCKGNNIFNSRLDGKFVYWQCKILNLHITKCCVVLISIEIWRRNTVYWSTQHGHIRNLANFLLRKLLPHHLSFCFTHMIRCSRFGLYDCNIVHLRFRQKIRGLNRLLYRDFKTFKIDFGH